MPLWITVVGAKKTGKTSTIEALIPALKQRGYRVATVKHTFHAHVFDTEGTDSYRHGQAGAGRVAVIGPYNLGLFAYDLPVAEAISSTESFLSAYDVILCEGFRDSPYPKIIITGGAAPMDDVAPPVIVRFSPLARPNQNSAVPDEVVATVLDYVASQLQIANHKADV